MAKWGFCKKCDRMVPIRPAAPKNPGPPDAPPRRQMDWYPEDHDGCDGKWCSGVTLAVAC